MTDPAAINGLLSKYLPQQQQQQEEGMPQLGKPEDPRVALKMLELKRERRFMGLDDAELMAFAKAFIEAQDQQQPQQVM